MSEVDRSVCTIVSLVPFELREEKPGLVPGLYVIPEAKVDQIGLLVIESASAVMFVGGEQVNVRIPVNADSIAKSIVYDYCLAQLGYGEDSGPGIFWVYGKHDQKSIMLSHATELADARKKQGNWFAALVRLADDDWASHHQHKTISFLQRFACNSLGLKREWTVEPKNEDIKLCPGCMTQVHPLAAICGRCHTIINEEAYKKLKRA